MFGQLKTFLPWLAVSVISFLLIFSNRNPNVHALRSNFGDIAVLAAEPLSSVLKAPRMWRENRALRQKLALLSLEVARLGELSVENEMLRKMLEYDSTSRFSLIAADVVGRSPESGIAGVTINRGSKDGVRRNLAAIIPEGAVGRVFAVGERSASVQLLTDPNIGIAGRLMRSREDGIVHYLGRGRFSLDGIPVTASVERGDLVVTSGLAAIFPENIPIGVVSQVSPAPNGWLLDIIVQPIVNYSRIEHLFIVGQDSVPAIERR